jgi:hypothetical protein
MKEQAKDFKFMNVQILINIQLYGTSILNLARFFNTERSVFENFRKN